jgi:hypothetical protein
MPFIDATKGQIIVLTAALVQRDQQMRAVIPVLQRELCIKRNKKKNDTSRSDLLC